MNEQELIDWTLRGYGYDPVQVGKQGKALAEVCLENVRLKQLMAEVSRQLAKVRELTHQEGAKVDHSFTNMWLIACDSPQEKWRNELYAESREGTGIREQWTTKLDEAIKALTDEVGV